MAGVFSRSARIAGSRTTGLTACSRCRTTGFAACSRSRTARLAAGSRSRATGSARAAAALVAVQAVSDRLTDDRLRTMRGENGVVGGRCGGRQSNRKQHGGNEFHGETFFSTWEKEPSAREVKKPDATGHSPFLVGSRHVRTSSVSAESALSRSGPAKTADATGTGRSSRSSVGETDVGRTETSGSKFRNGRELMRNLREW